ncbi:MAG TPA: nucleotide pyrophosphohydrolase [Myxococcota bacterium]|nr:nucleotide pyrophosphohydrolase [Myxococcota bacterium]
MLSPELLARLLEFRRERDWEQFHTPKNLAAALSVEAGELLDIFRWTRESEMDETVEAQREAIAAELADVTIILSYLYHDLGIDPDQAVADKLERNRAKYPVEKARGTARKWNRM